MARLTFVLSVITAVIAMLGGFRLILREWRIWRNRKRIMTLLVVLCGMLPSIALGSGTFSCSSPCVNGDAEVGNGSADSDTITIANAVAGQPIVVATRGGVNSSTVSIVNEGGPGTLTWTLLRSNDASDWVHTIHCAIIPTSGTYTFHTTNNTSGGTPSVRSIAVQYNTGVCAGAQVNSTTSNSGTSLSSGNVTTTSTSIVLSSIASDGDIDSGQGGAARVHTGGTVRNPNCNENPGIEPDQKICIGDRGSLTSGTYAAQWTVGSDIWSTIVVALPHNDTPASGVSRVIMGMARFADIVIPLCGVAWHFRRVMARMVFSVGRISLITMRLVAEPMAIKYIQWSNRKMSV
jgi:hypothetical protein